MSLVPATATGNITPANETVQISVNGAASVAISVEDTWAGTVVFLASVDGIHRESLLATPILPTGTPVSSTTSNGQWAANVADYLWVYVQGNTVSSGSATVVINSSTAPFQGVGAALAAGTNTIGKVDQGVGGTSAWKVDGSGVTQPVSAAALPLPTGAATSAAQGTANTSLATLATNSPALGPAPKAASIPVTLATDQPVVPTSLTPATALAGGALAAIAVVSATATTMYGADVRVDSTRASGPVFLQLWDTADATLAVPGTLKAKRKLAHVNGVDDQVGFDFGIRGIALTAGGVLALSTTETTYTSAGAYITIDNKRTT